MSKRPLTIKTTILVLVVLITIIGWKTKELKDSTPIVKSPNSNNHKTISSQPDPWPEWIFYHWVWEDEGTRQSATQLVDDYLMRDIPVGAIIIDSPWETGYNTFEFDDSLYGGAQSMIDSFHNKDVRVLLWITGIINTDQDSLYDYAASQSYFMQQNSADDSSLVNWWKGSGSLIDFYNPNAVTWWVGLMDKALALGIDGWKCDGTDYYSSVFKYSPYLDSNVQRIDYSHSYYQLFHDVTRDSLGNDRVNLLRPVDNYGTDIGGEIASFAPNDISFAGWVGDQDATFDGLKKALNNMYYSAEENYLSFGSDIGGYREDSNYPVNGRSKELFIRWAQLGAFSPIMENGGGGEHRPWQFDQQTVDIYRTFVKLHHSLVPYLMQTASNSYVAGTSMVSFFDKTDYGYLLGIDLFVAPIIEMGNNIDVAFPSGDNWVYLFDSTQIYAGGTTQSLIIPLDEYPVFMREGAAIFTDINDTEASMAINIYPNPALENVKITYSNPNAIDHQIRLFDVAGKLILEDTNTNGMLILNKGTITSGIYFLTITSPKHTFSKKLIFQ